MTNYKIKVVLFDADGVIITPKDPFSVQYARLHGLDPKTLGSFFDELFGETLTGKRDLKELLEKRRDLWKWKGTIEDLLQQWFKAENHVNQELVALIHQARAKGMSCYLVMNQEKYRTRYVKEVMFPGVFDYIYSSAEMGVKKPDPKFYQHIINDLQNAQVIIEPGDIAYFDDHPSNVRSAKALGLEAHLYAGIQQVKKILQIQSENLENINTIK
ncbi:MAG: HAD family hydrolase [Patescibacteria group bacterium]|jgi:HAD superfamily hydrolase (TIGR01509 family)